MRRLRHPDAEQQHLDGDPLRRSMETLMERLLSGRMAEFSYRGKAYLIQQENNKGWNYLSLWRTAPEPAGLGRAFFDIFEGVSEETVLELCAQPCLEGRSLQEILGESELLFS